METEAGTCPVCLYIGVYICLMHTECQPLSVHQTFLKLSSQQLLGPMASVHRQGGDYGHYPL